VIGRRGRKLYTTEAALRSVAPEMFEQGAVEQRVEELERRVDILQRLVHKLMGTRGALRGQERRP